MSTKDQDFETLLEIDRCYAAAELAWEAIRADRARIVKYFHDAHGANLPDGRKIIGGKNDSLRIVRPR